MILYFTKVSNNFLVSFWLLGIFCKIVATIFVTPAKSVSKLSIFAIATALPLFFAISPIFPSLPMSSLFGGDFFPEDDEDDFFPLNWQRAVLLLQSPWGK